MRNIAFVFILFFCTTVSLLARGGGGASDTITMKLGLVTPSEHPHSISSREFAKLVSEKTQGKIVIKVFDNGSLGSNPELLDGVKTGSIDLTVSTPGVMAEYGPVTGILELPYIFSSKEHMMKVTRGKVGSDIAAEYEKQAGIKIIGYFGGAHRNMITTSKPIQSIADLKGLKMRTWEWDVMINWWKALGAIGSVVSFPEVYTALQTGVVDGAENEFSTFTTARWAEVAKNIALTQHSITVRPLIINEQKFSSLPADLQTAFLEAAREAADFDVKLEGELDQKNMDKLKKDYNVNFTEPDKQPLIQASEKIIADFAKEKGLETVAAAIKNAAE